MNECGNTTAESYTSPFTCIICQRKSRQSYRIVGLKNKVMSKGGALLSIIIICKLSPCLTRLWRDTLICVFNVERYHRFPLFANILQTTYCIFVNVSLLRLRKRSGYIDFLSSVMAQKNGWKFFHILTRIFYQKANLKELISSIDIFFCFRRINRCFTDQWSLNFHGLS